MILEYISLLIFYTIQHGFTITNDQTFYIQYMLHTPEYMSALKVFSAKQDSNFAVVPLFVDGCIEL